jgi:Na+/H+-dicarboxylate symporter
MALWLQVLIAMALGLTTGLLLAPSGAGILSEHVVERVIPWIALSGNIFLALIKMVVIPLVFSSIVLGLASSPDPEFLRKAALRIFPYFVGWAMKLAPVAVFALICTVTMRIGLGAIIGMAAYIGTVVQGLVVLLIFYLVMVSLLGKMSQMSFLRNIREAWIASWT